VTTKIVRREKVTRPVRYQLRVRPDTTRLIIDFNPSQFDLIEQFMNTLFKIQEHEDTDIEDDSYINNRCCEIAALAKSGAFDSDHKIKRKPALRNTNLAYESNLMRARFF
jgi:hypothetical protein